MLTGNTTRHQALECELADFLQKPAAVLFNYGYLGVLGTISALVGPKDVILMDRLSHASIVDATVLASAGRRFHPCKHNDMDNLEFHLKAARRAARLHACRRGIASLRAALALCEAEAGTPSQGGSAAGLDPERRIAQFPPLGQGQGDGFKGVGEGLICQLLPPLDLVGLRP